MSREVPFDLDLLCDGCGQPGAYDFMGDGLCAKCAAELIVGEPPYEMNVSDGGEAVKTGADEGPGMNKNPTKTP